jgi:hypothetical protein
LLPDKLGGELLVLNVGKGGNVTGLVGVMLLGTDPPDEDTGVNPADEFEGVFPTGLEFDDAISLRNL